VSLSVVVEFGVDVQIVKIIFEAFRRGRVELSEKFGHM
jgi:hypothetical protein